MVVGVPETGQHLKDEREGGARVGPYPGVDSLLEVQSLEQLEGHEGRALVLAQLVDDDDVRMLEPGRGARFLHEALAGGGIGDPVRHHLEGHVAPDVFVACAVDGSHRTLAELAENAVAADPLWSAHGGNHSPWSAAPP
ncbi:MAG: hypothetical protein A2V74_02040 [Acidobacteria bacterium RBG_16_70_10]|nr:MAG: hypothetical protein A2V74_02040 [Acidobacteria bacterium RBG_16_70_10]